MIYESRHPLVKHKISHLRDKNTSVKIFRELVGEITMALFYEATQKLKTRSTTVETPLMQARGEKVAQDALMLVPILRAGLGMCEAVLRVVPNACVGHLGMARDEETLIPQVYYQKLPPQVDSKKVFVLDPMLATGGSLCQALEYLSGKGVQDITVLTILAALEGLQKVHKKFPTVPLYVAHIDEKLNEKGYILPGLGDAGDRIFGTL